MQPNEIRWLSDLTEEVFKGNGQKKEADSFVKREGESFSGDSYGGMQKFQVSLLQPVYAAWFHERIPPQRGGGVRQFLHCGKV